MSNLSELLPAGAGAKSADFVASGTLGSGQTVALNANGTVSVISASGIPVPSAGTPVLFESASTGYIGTTFDSNSNKVVIAYRDLGNSSYGTAIIGTVSGTSISFGSPVVFESATTLFAAATFDSNSNKVVIVYADSGSSSYGTAIVGTVSGTSISFGSPVVFESASSRDFSPVFDSNSNKVVIVYRDVGNSSSGTVIVGTVSGTSISFGSASLFSADDVAFISAVFDSNSNKVVIAYQDGFPNSDYGTAIVGTVSGTSVSFGSAVAFESAATSRISATFDSNSNKVVIAYTDQGNSNFGTAIVGTVSGTSISFGSAVVFESAATYQIGSTFDSGSNQVVIAYQDDGNSDYGTAIVGTVSGTSISFGDAVVFNSASTLNNSVTFDSSLNKVVIAYTDAPSGYYGYSVVFQTTASNNTDFIGITDQAIADTATGAVIVQGGVSDKVSGLTTGSDYYVQDDGSLSTTVSSVPAGRAFSTTSILLEG